MTTKKCKSFCDNKNKKEEEEKREKGCVCVNEWFVCVCVVGAYVRGDGGYVRFVYRSHSDVVGWLVG